MDDDTVPIPPDGEPRDRNAPLGPGSRLGKFRILGAVGAGAQGWVYRAYDENLRAQVALKVLHAPVLVDPQALHRFVHEGQLLARIEHPGVCRVREADVVDGQPYLAMDFIDGPSLRTVQQDPSSEPLTVEECLACCGRLARGLQAVHETGVLHRDLKPSNVLLPSLSQPVLIDFGIARDTTGILTELSMTGQARGTAGYISPEQLGLRGLEGTPDQRSDLFALGVVAYEWLCGQLPFAGETAREVERSLQNYALRPPRKLRRDLSRDTDALLLRALSYDPRDRFQTAAEMALAIEKIVQGEDPGLQKPTLAHKTKRWVQRNRAVTAVATAVFVLLSIALGFAIWNAVEANLSEHRAKLIAYHQSLEATDARLVSGDLMGAQQVLAAIEVDDFATRMLQKRLDPSLRRFSLGADANVVTSIDAFWHLVATSDSDLVLRVFNPRDGSIQSRTVAHLDIVPEQIFVSRESQRWIVVGEHGIRAGHLDSDHVESIVTWKAAQRVRSAASPDANSLVYAHAAKVFPGSPARVTRWSSKANDNAALESSWEKVTAHVDSLAMSDDGSLVAMLHTQGQLGGSQLVVLEPRTGRMLWQVSAVQRRSLMCFDTDSKSLLLSSSAIGSGGFMLRRFFAQTGAGLGKRRIASHVLPVNLYADLQRVVVGMENGVGIFLSPSLNRESARIALHNSRPVITADHSRGLLFSHSGSEVAHWDPRSIDGALHLLTGGDRASSLSFDSSGMHLYAGTDAGERNSSRILRWDLKRPSSRVALPTSDFSRWVNFRDGKIKYSGGVTLGTLDVEGPVRELSSIGILQALAFDKNLSLAVSRNPETKGSILVENGKMLKLATASGQSLSALLSLDSPWSIRIASSPDGCISILSGTAAQGSSRKSTVLVADLGSASLKELGLFEKRVTALEFPYADRFVIGFADGSLQVYEYPSLRVEFEIQASSERISHLASLGGRTYIAVADRSSVWLCHLEIGQSILALRHTQNRTLSLCYNRDLDALAAGYQQEVIVWSTKPLPLSPSWAPDASAVQARTLVDAAIQAEQDPRLALSMAPDLKVSESAIKAAQRSSSAESRSLARLRSCMPMIPLLPMPYYDWAAEGRARGSAGDSPIDGAQAIREGSYDALVVTNADFSSGKLINCILNARAGNTVEIPSELGDLIFPASVLMVEARALTETVEGRRVWLKLERLVTEQNLDPKKALSHFADSSERTLARRFMEAVTPTSVDLSSIVWMLAASHTRTAAQYKAAHNLALWFHELHPSRESELALALTCYRRGSRDEAVAHLTAGLRGQSLVDHSAKALMIAASLRAVGGADLLQNEFATLLEIRAHSPAPSGARGLWAAFFLDCCR